MIYQQFCIASAFFSLFSFVILNKTYIFAPCSKEHKNIVSLKIATKMKQYQIIRQEEVNGQVENHVVWTATSKREIEKWFNRILRGLKKNKKYYVDRKNIGWAIVEYFGEWSRTTTEYYICQVQVNK